MVEVGDSFDPEKGLFIVAGFTLLSESSLVWIGMARIAVAEPQAIELLEFLSVPCGYRVAFDALYRSVHSMKLKPGRTVAETRRRPERIHSVTGGTVLGKGFLMVVGMAGQAGLIQAQIGKLFLPDGRVGNVTGFVAIHACF